MLSHQLAGHYLGNWFKLRRRLITTVAPIIACVIVVAMTTGYPSFVAGTGFINDNICLQTSLPWFACSSGYGVSYLPYDSVRIGLINDNTSGPFDQSLSNQDEAKIETLIFKENQRACTSQHITLIAVTTLSRTVEDPLSGAALGVQNLRGYYLAQHSYNAAHPHISLCLAIANLGTPDTADKNSPLVKRCSVWSVTGCYSIPQVFHQIAQLARFDPSVRGIVGFPLSQQVTEALEMRKNYPSLAHLPIISPSASSDAFSATSNFYRMDAPDQLQGEAIAQYFCSNLVRQHPTATIAILTDGSNPYSGDISTDFLSSISSPRTSCSKQITTSTISYTDGDTASVQKAVDKALNSDHANYIFFPGYDEDLDTIQSEIHSDHPSQFFAILGGDGLNNVDATTTHYAYYPVYAASFAQPLSVSDSFVQDYMNEGFSKPYYYKACLWIPKDTLLAFDAVQAFTQTLQQNPGQTDLTQFTTNLESINFQGESGPIWFQGNQTTKGHMSDRTQDIIHIISYDQNHNIHLDDGYTATVATGNLQEKPLAQQC